MNFDGVAGNGGISVERRGHPLRAQRLQPVHLPAIGRRVIGAPQVVIRGPRADLLMCDVRPIVVAIPSIDTATVGRLGRRVSGD